MGIYLIIINIHRFVVFIPWFERWITRQPTGRNRFAAAILFSRWKNSFPMMRLHLQAPKQFECFDAFATAFAFNAAVCTHALMRQTRMAKIAYNLMH